MERIIKTITNDCQECGDCALFDLAYFCPMSQCPKNQRNGPCGGSRNGMCEVYPEEKKCIYVRAYKRLKAYGDEEQLREWVPPLNWELHQSSSWLNFYLGRDHTSKKIGIKASKAE
jgi:methylenetetrahydrofolate reductase (NADPH)